MKINLVLLLSLISIQSFAADLNMNLGDSATIAVRGCQPGEYASIDLAQSQGGHDVQIRATCMPKTCEAYSDSWFGRAWTKITLLPEGTIINSTPMNRREKNAAIAAFLAQGICKQASDNAGDRPNL